MIEIRLMNKDCIDSIIRTEEGMKHLVVDGEIVCSAPIAFNFDKYTEEAASKMIYELMEHLWRYSTTDGAPTYMDDLNDEMAYDVGRAYVAEMSPNGAVAVGRDIRDSSESLSEALIKLDRSKCRSMNCSCP